MTTVEGTGVGSRTLVERDVALATLHGAYAEVRAAGGRFVFVSGEAGIGKTSLVKAFCQTADDARVWVGACDPLSTPRPLGPFCDIAEPGGALADLVQLGAPPADVFAALVDELAERPTTLVVEDLHWADEASLDVLRLLARRIDALPALVLATYRDDALGRRHPVRVLLGDLATVPAIVRVGLEPLSRAAVAELAAGHEVDPETLYARTAGNPFFVTQVLDAGDTDVPPSVRDAVLARTAVLTPADLEVLEVVALAPPRAEPPLLEAVVGERPGSLERCRATGLVTWDDHGASFRHELARLVIEETLPPTRLRELHRRILAWLASGPAATIDPARLAHHAEAADDAAAVLRFAPEAARRAAAVGAHREAAAQYARALRFGGSLAPGQRAALLEGRSRACYLADDQLEAIDVIREAIACRQQEGAPLQEARAMTELADYLSCRGFHADVDETLRRASQLVEGRPEEREHAYVLYSTARFARGGDIGTTMELAGRAVEIGESFGDEHVAGHARVTIGLAVARDDLDAGLLLLERAVELARAHGQPEVVARAFNGMGAVCGDWHRHDLADAHYEAGLEYCSEHASDLWRINILAMSALSFLAQARFDDAARRATAILHDPRESPWPHFAALVVLALARARRGDPGAREALAAARAVPVPPDELAAHVDGAAANAEVAWTERRTDEVADATESTLSAAIERRDTDAICRLSFWRRLAGLEVGIPADASGPYALALAGEWQQAATEWTRRGQPYEAAIALSFGQDEDALRLAHAEFRRLGARPLAGIVARELRERGVRDVPRGPQAATRANDASLTPRELEVLEMVAGGHRDAEIAERLVLSPRTVEHHVAAIRRKLGARTRGEAVAEAGRLGLLER